MDPLHAPINPQTSSTSPKELSSKDPVSAQGSKIPDLGEKGKFFFKAAVQKGSDTFEKVKNYFGGTSKLSASKYKEEVLKQLSESELKEQIKGMSSINDIRTALYTTDQGNSIDSVASFYGKTATAQSDLGKLKDSANRAGSAVKEKLGALKNAFSANTRVKNEILSHIDKALKTNKDPELIALRAEVSKATTTYEARVAVNRYQIMSNLDARFEEDTPLNPEQYKRSVLSQLDNARAYAELNDLETRDFDRLGKLINLASSPEDIRTTISESNLEGFDPDLVHDNAVSASHYTNVDKLEAAAKNAADRIRNLFKT